MQGLLECLLIDCHALHHALSHFTFSVSVQLHWGVVSVHYPALLADTAQLLVGYALLQFVLLTTVHHNKFVLFVVQLIFSEEVLQARRVGLAVHQHRTQLEQTCRVRAWNL